MVDQPYIAVVEDDLDVAFYSTTMLEKRGCVVGRVANPIYWLAPWSLGSPMNCAA
jgi:hypothetical protein